jgi:hypothetical protein
VKAEAVKSLPLLHRWGHFSGNSVCTRLSIQKLINAPLNLNDFGSYLRPKLLGLNMGFKVVFDEVNWKTCRLGKSDRSCWIAAFKLKFKWVSR